MSNIRYKLSTQERTTHNGFKLPDDGVWFQAKDMKNLPVPCTNTVLHHYAHPLLAVLFNPIHADIDNPRLFEIEIDKEIDTDGLKGWCRRQRIIREIEVPVITTEERVAFAIYYAERFASPDWMKWATNWMNGTDRTAEAARAAAARAVVEAAWAAAENIDLIAIALKAMEVK